MELVIQKTLSRIIIVCLMVCVTACVNYPRIPGSNQTVRGAAYGAGAGAAVGAIAQAGGVGVGAAIGGTAGVVIGHDIRRNMTQLQLLEAQLMKGRVQFIRQGAEYKLVLPADYYFYIDAPRLTYSGRYYLNEIARYLTFFDITSLRVISYTDNEGLPERNQALSNAQAQMVVAYLTKHNPDIRLMTARGMGADYPVATNRDAKGRALNRRVEIIFRFNLCPSNEARFFWRDLADCQKWESKTEPFVRVR